MGFTYAITDANCTGLPVATDAIMPTGNGTTCPTYNGVCTLDPFSLMWRKVRVCGGWGRG